MNIKKETNFGEMRASLSLDYSSRDDLFRLISECVVFDEEKLNNLIMFIDDNYEKIGFLGSILIKEEHRGKGLGKKFMEDFMDKISSKSDIDFLFARIDNPQLNNFELVKFYKKYGFESVTYNNSEMLMINKGQKQKIALEVFNIKENQKLKKKQKIR